MEKGQDKRGTITMIQKIQAFIWKLGFQNIYLLGENKYFCYDVFNYNLF